MSELVTFLQGMTPGGYGIWVGVLMFLAYWVKEWRETRKLSSEDRQARREGFEAQVTLLMNENRALRAEMQNDRKVHADYRHLCHQETDLLRQHIIRLEDEVAGYKRRLDTQAIKVAQISPTLAPGEEREVK